MISAKSSAAKDIVDADHIPGVVAPEVFKHLYGHVETFSALFKQFEADRAPGGILLHGPKGIGKATLAFALARKIMIASGDDEAEVREQIALGVHPNVKVLRRAARERSSGFYQNIRVDEVRSVLRQLQQTRGRAGRRIIIVDAIDDCNASAANALLKTLEEPPAKTHLILISNRPGALLPTIRSRCQAHTLRPLANDQVEELLKNSSFAKIPKGAKESDEAQSADKIKLAIKSANGSPRRAFQALGMANVAVLKKLSDWLKNPAMSGSSTMLEICEILANKKNQLEAKFAREIILQWIATETRQAATISNGLSGEAGAKNLPRLASAIELWEKTNELFETSDSFNLDQRQGFIILFDQIFTHAQRHLADPISMQA